ncbi:MAG: HWE histidine kinase domain-containing protein [Pararhodobacter sp.]
MNPGYQQLVGDREVLGKPVAEALPEVATQGFIDMLDKAYRSGEAVTGAASPVMLNRRENEGPEQRYVDFVYQPIHDHENTVTHIFVQGADVTERVLGERQQKLLMNELAHRVRNTLATVRAIAMRTLRSAKTLQEAETSLNARILALSRAQEILTSDSRAAVDLRRVISSAIGAHDDGSRRFRIEGPDLRLNAGAALALSLALHELSTNASKYGALSVDTGLLSITWTLKQREDALFLQMIWEETGGPPVTPPTHRGFGSTLIEEAVAAETGGTARLDYRPAGIVFTLEAPLAFVEEKDA